MAEHSCINSLSLETMQLVNEFVWMHEDTSEFIAARAKALIIKYYQQLLPPFTQALFQYTQDNPEYSWAAPGHQGGVAFSKTAVGREFLDFFGENLFRTDTGIERESLGSLLDHSGPIKESEAYAAQVLVHMQVTRCLMAHRALIAPLWPLSWEISRSHCVIVTVINPLSRDWSCRVHYRYFLFQPVTAMALLDQFLKHNSNPRLLHKN